MLSLVVCSGIARNQIDATREMRAQQIPVCHWRVIKADVSYCERHGSQKSKTRYGKPEPLHQALGRSLLPTAVMM